MLTTPASLEMIDADLKIIHFQIMCLGLLLLVWFLIWVFER